MTTTLRSPRLAGLVRLATERAAALRSERCELCRAPVPPEHRHILDVSSREPLCACRACAVLFDRDAAGGDHFRLIPDRRQRIRGVGLDDAWDDLGVPVGLAYFVATGRGEILAVYPGPAGVIESTVDADVWHRFATRDDVVASMRPDVEGLLVRRLRGTREQWVVPIDDCYRLVAVLRSHWRGMTGGDEVWREVDRFFDALEQEGTAP